MAIVYWIHRNLIHTDPKTEGYIGITSRTKEDRYEEHLRYTTNKHLRNALAVYRDIVISELHVGDLQDCLDMEEAYRPTAGIGWNLAPGGGNPPPVSMETAAKVRETIIKLGVVPYCANTNSPEAKEKRRKRIAGNRIFHNTVSGEYRTFRANEIVPSGWMPGRVPRPAKVKKQSGVDYGNIGSWKVTDPTGVTHTVTNLKNWCKENGVKYSTVVGSYCGYKSTKT